MLNVVALMGRLTAAPELRHTSSNIPVTTFTLAVERAYVKAGAERQADFIDVVAWRQTAEFATRYFRKGQLVAVDGSIQTRSYTDSQGIKRKAFEIVANNLHFAEPKRDNYGSHQAGPEYGGSQEAPSFANADAGDFEEITADDDLPF